MGSKTITLSAKGLGNIVADVNDEFSFIIGDDIYTVNHSNAEYMSPHVAKLRETDKTIDTFVIEIEDDEKLFQQVVNLMNGLSINVSSVDAQILKMFAEKLGNIELYEEMDKTIKTHMIENETAVPILLNKYKARLNYAKEIQYIALHFYEITFEDKIKIPLPSLEQIMQNNYLKVETEDDLFDFIFKIVNENGQGYRVLFEYLWFEYLDEKNVEKFLKMTNPSDINAVTWNAISKRLLMKVEHDVVSKVANRYSAGTIPFTGDPFKGIISQMNEEIGGNPHNKGLIKISYLGGNPYCDKLFDYDWKSYWSSTNESDQWISFEFTQNYIYLTDYSIKTPNWEEGWNHLKDWAIEGSINGGEKWEIIDQRKNNNDLNGSNKVATFHCQRPMITRCLRLRQTGKNHRDSDDIQLTNIEFFGRLSDVTSKADNLI